MKLNIDYDNKINNTERDSYLTHIKIGEGWCIEQCENFDFKKKKITMSWSRSSVYKGVFFIGVEENDTLDKFDQKQIS